MILVHILCDIYITIFYISDTEAAAAAAATAATAATPRSGLYSW